jgi:hypothetical protein
MTGGTPGGAAIDRGSLGRRVPARPLAFRALPRRFGGVRG